MRGKMLHNKILIRPLAEVGSMHGAGVFEEYQVRKGRGSGFIDLMIFKKHLRVAVEAELTPDRIGKDIVKAIEVKATHLLIVVPNGQTRTKIEHKLRIFEQQICDLELSVNVKTLGTAIPWLTQLMNINDRSDCPFSHEVIKSNKDYFSSGGKSCE